MPHQLDHDSKSDSVPLVSLARSIRQRERSAVEVLDGYARRVADLNPDLNAIVSLDLDTAFGRAREADQALARGECWGPLHGVPFALKDCHEVADFPTTAGSRLFAEYRPARDGYVMQRLRSAGGVLFGRTNVPELLADFQCANPLHGRTSNPFDHRRTSGGSTGGAAAVATDMTPFDIGTDMSGSVRLPAAFCGVYGLKPTENRISLAGAFPNPQAHPRQVRAVSCVGPVARTLDDLQMLLGLLVRAMPEDMDVPPVPLAQPERGVTGLRVAYVPAIDNGPIATAIAEVLERAAGVLAERGAIVEQVPFPVEEVAGDLLAHAELVRTMVSAFQDSGARAASYEDYLRQVARREQRSAVLEHFLSSWDVLLCPVAMANAFPHCTPGSTLDVDGSAQPYSRIASHVAYFNYTGHPALSVPAGCDDHGLPIGVQLVAARWRESTLLAAAGSLEAAVA